MQQPHQNKLSGCQSQIGVIKPHEWCSPNNRGIRRRHEKNHQVRRKKDLVHKAASGIKGSRFEKESLGVRAEEHSRGRSLPRSLHLPVPHLSLPAAWPRGRRWCWRRSRCSGRPPGCSETFSPCRRFSPTSCRRNNWAQTVNCGDWFLFPVGACEPRARLRWTLTAWRRWCCGPWYWAWCRRCCRKREEHSGSRWLQSGAEAPPFPLRRREKPPKCGRETH